MKNFTIKSVAQMRSERQAYWKSAHLTPKHVPETQKIISAFWKRSRGADTSVWDEVTKYKDGNKWPKITGPIIKTSFRKYIASIEGSFCCYCSKPLANTAAAKPIEHILPRDKYPQFSMHFWNLAVACVDCNSEKLNQIWFKIPLDKRNYPAAKTFVDAFHPRFHIYTEHIEYVGVSDKTGVVDLYVGHTKIGEKLCSEFLSHVVAKRIAMLTRPALAADVNSLQQYSAKARKIGAKEIAEFSAELHRNLQKLLID